MYVGNGNIHLYTNEDCIGQITKETIKEFYLEFPNDREYAKKCVELFHLLTFLDLNKELDNVCRIIPNEPGDFLVTINDKEYLYELVTVFGDREAKTITDNVKKILQLESIILDDRTPYPPMDTAKLSSQFSRILNNKKDKEYFETHDNAILLLITSEHDRSGTAPWYLVEDLQADIKEFTNVTKAPIKTMNYFRSGLNSNPEIENIEDEIERYNKEC